MAETQFYSRPKGMTVGEILAQTDAVASEGADLTRFITDIAPIDKAGPTELSFLEGGKYSEALASCRAGALLTTQHFAKQAPAGLTLLVSKQPYQAFVAIVRTLYPESLRPTLTYGDSGISSAATIHPTARIEDGVTIDPGAVIGADTEIGAGTVIASNAVIGRKVRIGRNSSVGANSSLIHTIVGDRVIIHPGCHIGQDGFGFVSDARGHTKVPQIGSVIIHDDVEIGAGTKIDRGGVRDTVIGEGTKIDNLVQIGHNVSIGKHCIIVGMCGISGSATLEDFVVLGAGVGVIPHVTIGKGAQLAARATVIRDVPPGARWGGTPNAKPVKQWMREMVVLEKLGLPAGKDIKRPPDMDD